MSKWPFKVLVKYASRGRRQRFFDGLDNIFELAEFPYRILVLISIDEDAGRHGMSRQGKRQ